MIRSTNGKVLKETEYFCKNGIYKLGQLLQETAKESRKLPYDKILATLAKNIQLDTNRKKEDMVFLGNKKKVEMSMITQKDLYEDAIFKRSNDHSYETKWVEKLQILIVWEEVWNTVHNFLLSNTTKTLIWEQLHLNFYTQYSYNKWHKKQNICPLCRKIPQSIYHIILHCEFANNIWTQIQPILFSLHRVAITDTEKALGIVSIKSTTGIQLRNWLTYKLREQIMHFERIAYHSSQTPSLDLFKAKFNQAMALEVKNHLFRFKNENKISDFDETIAHGGILCEKIQEGEYRFKILLK